MLNLRNLSLNCLFNDANTIMLIFCYFTGCISHLSLIIILNKTSVFIHLEAATGRSSTKLLFYISGKPIKISQWKCSIFISNFTKIKLLHWYFSKIQSDIFTIDIFTISLILCGTAILKNIHFQKQFSPKVFCKKGVRKIFAKFTGKRQCQNLFLNKAAALGLQLY